MLVDQFNEQKLDVELGDGVRHGDPFVRLKKRIAEAEVFVLDPDATAMAASVALSRPSSILAALAFARLPFKSVWIEFENDALRRAMADLGSPNLQAPATMSRIIRSGFLLTGDGDGFDVEYVHSDEVPDGRRMIEAAPLKARFSLGERAPERLPRMAGGVPSAKGKVREHLKLISQDPGEAQAHEELESRFDYVQHPDLGGVHVSMVRLMGEDRVEAIIERQAREAWRLFSLQILPALILLNCRNAVATRDVPVSPKLNKQRAAKGKPPLVRHRVVGISLTKAKTRMAAAGTAAAQALRAALVMGHFKVRKTGIFWWHPHVRGGHLSPAEERTVRVLRG